MAILYRCPNCGVRYRSRGHSLGHHVTCLRCKHGFIATRETSAPSPGEEPTADAPNAEDPLCEPGEADFDTSEQSPVDDEIPPDASTYAESIPPAPASPVPTSAAHGSPDPGSPRADNLDAGAPDGEHSGADASHARKRGERRPTTVLPPKAETDPSRPRAKRLNDASAATPNGTIDTTADTLRQIAPLWGEALDGEADQTQTIKPTDGGPSHNRTPLVRRRAVRYAKGAALLSSTGTRQEGEQGSHPSGETGPTVAFDAREHGSALPASAHPPTVSADASRLEAGAWPGEDVVEYELLEPLGEGGMGIVYRAKQTSCDRMVAVKLIKGDLETRAAAREKFMAEAAVTADLDHPNIVPVHDLGATPDGSLFYAMKAVRGMPWDRVIGAKTQAENLEILLRVADAVAFAHSKGIIHRDIKPENVMLGGYGEVLLMDWGLAIEVDERGLAPASKGALTAGGTPAYMAPEMARGKQLGVHCDIYLLGAVLYEILAGHPPHQGDSARACLIAAAKNEIVATQRRGELLEIAIQAMAYHPAKRYPSAQAFQDAIRAYQSHLESIELTHRADALLDEARRASDYRGFAKALFAYEEAHELWRGNQRACSGAEQARMIYAETALAAGDLDLAESLLSPNEGSHLSLLKAIWRARAARRRRTRWFRAMAWSAAALAAVAILILATALVWIQQERDRTVAEQVKRREAEEEKTRAVQAQLAAEQERRALEQAARSRQEARAKAWPHYLKGLDFAERRGQEAKAYAAFSKAIEISPDFAEAYFERGRMRTDPRAGAKLSALSRAVTQSADEAIDDLLTANRLSLEQSGKGNAYALRLAGDQWRDRNDGKADIEKALALYDEAIAVDPESPHARLAKAISHHLRKDLEQALAAAEALAREHPEIWEAHYTLAMIHGRMNIAGRATAKGNLESALEAIDAAIAANPTRGNLYLLRAFLRDLAATEAGRKGDPEAVLPDLLVAKMLEPDAVSVYASLMSTYHLMGRREEGDAAARRVAELGAEHPTYLMQLAQYYLETKRDPQSLAYIDKALDKEPDARKALVYAKTRNQILQAMGKKPKGINLQELKARAAKARAELQAKQHTERQAERQAEQRTEQHGKDQPAQ